MEVITYKLSQFEGPLDLLLTLIQKNKLSITDIPISFICAEYMAYINRAQMLDMGIASEFIVMASELMLIKSKTLIPRTEEEEKDPRADLADALTRYAHAKEAAGKLAALYGRYGGRTAKDTDEISVDKSFVKDYTADELSAAIKRILTYNSNLETAKNESFKPILSRQIIPVEIKIASIIRTVGKKGYSTLGELIGREGTLADAIASFLAILELIKIRKLLLDEAFAEDKTLLDADTKFTLNTDVSTVLKNDLGVEGGNADGKRHFTLKYAGKDSI